MSLRPVYIYDSLSRQKRKLEPLRPPEVSLYVCGPTVYDLLHIGNFRGYVVFNMARNVLEDFGYTPRLAVNFTDVEDKIIKRGLELNLSSLEVSEKYIEECKKDFQALDLRSHSVNPKVTETMTEIIDFIRDLILKGHAYQAGEDVYYSIENFPEYGKLSHRKTQDLLQGVRIDVQEQKKNPLDFALWKGSKEGEPFWESPWGRGRPGWHIECSAMIEKHLGPQIDIHGGGMDLLFPHHENEIAQTEAKTGRPLAQIWMHWNMLNLSGTKMSKSLGNILSLREFLEINHPEIYKWMILSVHHRSVFEFGEESLDRAVLGLAKVYSALALAKEHRDQAAALGVQASGKFKEDLNKAQEKVRDALGDDFNTPESFAVLYEWIKLLNSRTKAGVKPSPDTHDLAASFLKFIGWFGNLLSLFNQEPRRFLVELDDKLLAKMNLERFQIQKLVLEREEKRKQKDFKASDELRNELQKMGIAVSDTPQGSIWEVHKGL